MEHRDLKKLVEDAWLNISVDEELIYNPLLDIPTEMKDEPHLYITWLLSRPEYFSFICNELLNIKILPIQAVILQELWHRKFPMFIASRGFGKSWTLALYTLLRLLLMPGRKIVLTGSGFRQSKIIFEYMESIWRSSPILRDMVGNPDHNGIKKDTDMWKFNIGESTAVAIPVGNGQKIRGLRAHDLLCDEFASMIKQIFETVMSGFLSVKASPIESVVLEASRRIAEQYGVELDEEYDESLDTKSNQLIISGTAYYQFNHFYSYFKEWHSIIHSGGNPNKLYSIKSSTWDEDLDWKRFSIIRIPYELIPAGFMDAGNVARTKATVHSGTFNMEFGSVFSADSMGFFRRSLIEGCVVPWDEGITLNGNVIKFDPMLIGNSGQMYVYGIDPAADVDNFSITVLEIHPDHRRIVYCWTTNSKDHQAKLKAGLIAENKFYTYCARKIRDLMKIFPCIKMSMDSQGGGKAVLEALNDADKMEPGEIPLWPTIVEDKPTIYDDRTGLHIIDMVNFADAMWTGEANHGMKFDFETKTLLFPRYDSIMLEMSSIEDINERRTFDTLEDCVANLEQLKDELSMIVMTQTLNGRDKWDTPEVKLPNMKTGRMRKDRYSALLMANKTARDLGKNLSITVDAGAGGFAHTLDKDKDEQQGDKLFDGPEWFVSKIGNIY